jgi:glutamate-1-semialdehyde aminotransferase
MYYNKTHTQVYEGILKEYIAHGALVNSKRAESHVYGVYPVVAVRGSGPHFWDHAKNRYIDFICALGTQYFGYGNRRIAQAMDSQAKNGVLFSVASTKVAEVAHDLRDIFTHCDRMRFLKSGSDGCSAAIRIARTFTGRDTILSDGYHGYHDSFTSLTSPATGCPSSDNLHIKSLKDISQVNESVAAVIIEPIIIDASQERIDYLYKLRDACEKSKTLLIFDETITAYRFKDFSVARTFHVKPDISVQGKCLANGMPFSMVGGRKDVMEADYFVSTSFAGEALTLAAVSECIKMIRGEYSPADLWNKGIDFLEEFNSIAPDIVSIEGYPTRGVLRAANDTVKALFMQECCRGGVIFGPSWFYSHDLHKCNQEVFQTVRESIARIKNGKAKLLGRIPQSPFAQKVRKL